MLYILNFDLQFHSHYKHIIAQCITILKTVFIFCYSKGNRYVKRKVCYCAYLNNAYLICLIKRRFLILIYFPVDSVKNISWLCLNFQMNTNDTKRLCHRRNADECIKSQRDHVSLRKIFANWKLNCLRYVDTIFYLASLKFFSFVYKFNYLCV